MDRLRDGLGAIGDAVQLRYRLREDGYVFLPGLLDAGAVLRVRADVTATLGAIGWLASDRDPMEAVPSARAVREEHNADPEYFVMYEAIQRLQSFHELAHHPALLDVLGRLVGEEVLVHPRKIARVALPKDYGYNTPPHQDFRLIQGTADVITVWVPIGDCPDELGGLAVLPGSQRDGLRPVELAQGPGVKAVGVEGDEPGWVTADYSAGDVLLFHSLTIHAGKQNHADALRLSADFRYQSVHEPVVPASLGPHYHPRIPDWDELTDGWSATWSVGHPDTVRTTDFHDMMDEALVPPPPRLIEATS